MQNPNGLSVEVQEARDRHARSCRTLADLVDLPAAREGMVVASRALIREAAERLEYYSARAVVPERTLQIVRDLRMLLVPRP